MIMELYKTMRTQGGFSLLEVLVCSFILSILSVSILHGLTALELESRLAKSRMNAGLLAADLREEILSRPPLDPDGSPVMGREAGESGGRLSYDDQDDYQGYVDGPPTDIGGAPLAGMERLSRAVRIENVAPDRPAGPSTDTGPRGLRRFTVTVYRDKAEIARLVWLGVGQEP
ncbi:MAG: hypothetical protein A3G34_00855 [Candidatus Lindowbacteria bacterium RIFCSPLOWO2_12_FULL_62_27]|nr:MAG: hypothetical protein A3G34_00855 [Candidatus Lindowbacteria bacterium RIFCSPLOWO2_12_FULL_62_27]OGH58145.1 MAG: hypothetical protein A3I06_00690 [Candidatus Lindowbacteria bacterium RIFCSPLOWO2_02_FULL_62_12]